MTSAERTKRAWQELKARCCTNPKTAIRIVQLSEAEFRAVMIPAFGDCAEIGVDKTGNSVHSP